METSRSTASAPSGQELIQVLSYGLDEYFVEELTAGCSLSTCCEYAGSVASMDQLESGPEQLLMVKSSLLNGDGFDAMIALRRRNARVKFASVGETLPPRTLAYAFRLGLKAILTGHEGVSEIVRCLQVVCGEGAWIPRDQVIAAMTEVMPMENPRTEKTWTRLPALTEREGQILAELLEGKANKTIASDLGISEQTVKLHLNRVYGKLGVARRGELMNALADMRGRLPVQRLRML